jgi:hypothetical protein
VKHFCDELKAAREYKKVTLEQISATTKINVTFLQALEDGRWDILPEPYIKGFLKAYAQCVGMNVLKVLKKYDELEKGVSPSEEKTAEEEGLVPPEPPPAAPRSRFPAVKVRTYGVLYGVLVIAIVVVGVILVSRRSTEPVEESQAGTKQEMLIPPADTIEITASAPQIVRRRQELSATEPFRVSVTFQEPCYVEILLDDTLSRDYLFQAGQSKRWEARQVLWMKIGNAGGVQVSHNNRELGDLGLPNQVVTLTFGSEGVTEKILGPKPIDIVPTENIEVDSN